MHTLHDQILFLISTPLYIVIIGAEIFISHLEGVKAYTVKDTLYNFCLSMLTGLADLIMRGISFLILGSFFQLTPLSFPHSALYWIILLLFVDLMHYWLHRLGHTCRLIWAVHVNHHSSSHFNFSVGFRSGVLEPFYSFLFFIPIALAGFRPVDILFIYSIVQVWAILTHTEKVNKLGWLEYIFVTPSHHRVHHASNPKYLDKNMSTMLIIWDKIFGTFQPELPADEYEPIRYGTTSSLDDKSLPNVIFHEWRDIWKDIRRKDIGWKDKWRYIVGPPGWSHDSSRMTSEQARQKELDSASRALKRKLIRPRKASLSRAS